MKLITKEIATKLKAADKAYLASPTGTCGDEIIVKYFNPVGAATWYIVSGTPLDSDGNADYETDSPADWQLFGFCDLGMLGCEELGYVMLNDLKDIRLPFQMGIERDMGYKGTLPEVQALYARRAA